MIIVAGTINRVKYIIKTVHCFLFHTKAGTKKQQQRFITAVQQLSYKAIGHCIRIGAGIGSNRNRRLPLYFSNRGNSRLNAGRISYTFQRVAAVRIIGSAVTMLPIVSYPFDDFSLTLRTSSLRISV